jgi:high-affinity nickel-transport protein
VLDAFALGARHGFDADHLAAISELTASERGGVRGFAAGIRYALGHAAAVAALGFAAGAAGLDVPAWVVGVTLVGLGAWAAVRLTFGHSHEHVHVDEVTGEVIQHRHRHRHAVGVGVIHGLGGAPSAVIAGGRGGVALAAFTVGLLLVNGLVGAVAGVSTKVTALAWGGIVGGAAYGAALIAGWV